MASHELPVPKIDLIPTDQVASARQRERALARMLMTYISTGLTFMLLPGTFLGVWNLLSISGNHASTSVSAAWIQAHGHAQVFGWIGTFILGIGFYSIPKMRRAQPFAMWEAWVCWTMWTAGILLRWVSTVYEWHWRLMLPVSAGLELLAFAIFFKTVSSHRPAANGEAKPKLDRWISVVIAGALGLLATVVANLIASINTSLHALLPAFGQSFDQRFLVLMAWGFIVPFLWGFSARWLSTFIGLRPACERGLMFMVAVNTAGVVFAMLGFFKVAVFVLLVSSIMSLLAIRVAFPAVQPAKVQGIHKSFPYFVRLAYGWLIVAALLGIWAAFAQHPDGIWGASRHALTVGFVSTMVFAIGQRILPAFSGMRLLYSRNLMAAALSLLAVGCFLRVSSEVIAYQGFARSAWTWLPLSAVIELTAVTLFAVNMFATLVTSPPSRLVQIKAASPAL
jgi:uncharacterized protein involved in response to NO